MPVCGAFFVKVISEGMTPKVILSLVVKIAICLAKAN